jgi:hypothetical protein
MINKKPSMSFIEGFCYKWFNIIEILFLSFFHNKHILNLLSSYKFNMQICMEMFGFLVELPGTAPGSSILRIKNHLQVWLVLVLLTTLD